MSVFQLENWIEKFNYDDHYMPLINYDGEYNSFQNMPDSYVGTIEDWWKELDDFEDFARQQALESAKELYVKILDLNRLE
jgi:hypothetical protein